MSSERQLDVLRAIVTDYVRDREPVGSRNLVDRHNLGVSPATIRNDMAALEDGGYITQPHTSAGRVPTDKGYRLFVDQIAAIKPMSGAERRAISGFLDSALDLDEVLERSVRLLAHLTHQVAVVQYPSLQRSTLRHVEIVPVAHNRVMVVVITDNGRVEQRVVDAMGAQDAPTLEQPTIDLLDGDAAVLGELRARINSDGVGLEVPALSAALANLGEHFQASAQNLVRAVVAAVLELLAESAEDRIVMAGTANLARADSDFTRTISPVLEALEEQVVLLQLLGEMAEDSGTTPLAVRIGHETSYENLSETSVIAGGYGGGANQPVAQLGVLGPTRMDYPGTMSAVRAVARYISRILSN